MIPQYQNQRSLEVEHEISAQAVIRFGPNSVHFLIAICNRPLRKVQIDILKNDLCASCSMSQRRCDVGSQRKTRNLMPTSHSYIYASAGWQSGYCYRCLDFGQLGHLTSF